MASIKLKKLKSPRPQKITKVKSLKAKTSKAKTYKVPKVSKKGMVNKFGTKLRY